MRTCNCSGGCGPDRNQFNRREFIGLVGAGAAATLLAAPAWGAFSLSPGEWERWKRDLMKRDKPRRYLSDKHTDARMHLGGIGTGNIEIGADGQFSTWQLFNTLRDGQVPFYFLARTGSVTRLLQTAGGPDWPRVPQIEMRGEYPVVTLQFHDPELVLEFELTAFSPFAPLDTRVSSTPLAAFVFRIHNPGNQVRTASLAALMQNPIGYEAAGENRSITNPVFGANFNEALHEGALNGLFFRAEAATEPTLDQAVVLYIQPNLKTLQEPPPDRPHNLTVEVLEGQPVPASTLTDPAHTVVWLEEPPVTLGEPFLRSAREAVQAGATLVFSGRSQPLLAAYASWTGGKPLAEAGVRPDILFEDFEHGYDRWQVEGEAFGKEPAHGTLPGQQPVSGFLGGGLVNSFLHGDAPTGRLVSKSFPIERRFIRFLVGGGHFPNTQIRLLVDGQTVRSSSGKDNEQLEPALWNVSELEGRTAHLEIVDQESGSWGHVNIDQIEFTDLPGDRAVMALLEELLPARFQRVVAGGDGAMGPISVRFEGLALQAGAEKLEAPPWVAAQFPTGQVEKNGAGAALSGLPNQVLARRVGQGRVLLADGPVLDPSCAGSSQHRSRAYTVLCGWVGARYAGGAGPHPKAPGFGTLALGCLAGQVTVLPEADDLDQAWHTFSAEGRFIAMDAARTGRPTPLGRTTHGAVATSVEVPAGATVEVPFLLAWHYPNKYSSNEAWMGCHYATQWADARAVLQETAAGLPALRELTEKFRSTFYDSTLPYWLLDCLTADAAIIRHVGVVFRIANGDVYGWEGSNGCCDPTCTHVWGYEQSLARLFPALEKEMRRIDLTHQQRPNGGINNRTDVPSPPRPTGEQPFSDGHASCILKAYREALNHPDETLFQEYWPHINRAVEYLIDRDAKAAGGEPAGILQDDQWNTYDEALHGVTTFISGYYLAALRAGEAWARRLGHAAVADRFQGVFEKGQHKLLELCWNGEYFQQHLPDYLQRQGEVGPGCMADQLIGQWWAHQLGLGYLLPREKVVSALRAIFAYNFKSDLTGWKHSPRAFAGAGDKGLIICTWPKGGRPDHVMLYSDEVWTGIEYQVAAHLIYEGLVEEGFAIAKAARERYDGVPRAPIPRNPWNEIECGGHYARAMSSWSLLLATSGWHYDGPKKALRFAPAYQPDDFKCLFTGPEAWGAVAQSRQGKAQQNRIDVRQGRFTLAQWTLPIPAAPATVRAAKNGQALETRSAFDSGALVLSWPQPVTLDTGDSLIIQLG